jgi:hypothetical protein
MTVNLLLRRSLPFLVIGLLAGVRADASIARAVGFQEKVDTADAIILGKVVSTQAEWDPTRRWIVTRSTIQVEKALKGTPAPQLTLVTPGGSVDGIRQETIGVPSFAPGGEHVVFVRSTANGPTVAFFEQGVFDVTRDGRGRALVEPVASELVLIDRETRRAAAADSTTLTLEDFERKVANAVRAGEQRRLAMDARGGGAEPAGDDALAQFAREHRVLFVLGALGVLLLLGAILYKRA